MTDSDANRSLLKMVELNKKRREKDEVDDNNCYNEEENDPAYLSFLNCLKGHGKSYMLEGEEKGLPFSIKYEGDSGTDEACELEPRRKLRSAMKQNKVPLDQMPLVENQKNTEMVNGIQLRSKSKNEKEKNVNSTPDIETDPDYLIFGENQKAYNDDSLVYNNGSHTITRRKLRSAVKQNDVPLDQMPLAENQKNIEMVNGRQLRSKSKSEKEKNVKPSTPDIVSDPDYLIFRENQKVYDDDGLVCDNGSHTIPRRKLRSAVKQSKVPLDQMPLVENQKNIEMVNGRQLVSKSTIEKKNKVKSSNPNKETEPDYRIFRSNLKVYDDNSLVYSNGSHKIVYSRKVGNNKDVEEEDNDGSFSGVTFLGCSSPEEGNLNFSMMNNSLDIMDATSRCDFEFRQKVITVLRSPYDEEEYDMLWQDVRRRKAIGGRHLDLRKGREGPCSLEKEGKSYLDHYPGLEIKLLQAQDDKPKCLNLLRGFFYWLKLPGPFCPWEDPECLAINSKSS